MTMSYISAETSFASILPNFLSHSDTGYSGWTSCGSPASSSASIIAPLSSYCRTVEDEWWCRTLLLDCCWPVDAIARRLMKIRELLFGEEERNRCAECGGSAGRWIHTAPFRIWGWGFPFHFVGARLEYVIQDTKTQVDHLQVIPSSVDSPRQQWKRHWYNSPCRYLTRHRPIGPSRYGNNHGLFVNYRLKEKRGMQMNNNRSSRAKRCRK